MFIKESKLVGILVGEAIQGLHTRFIHSSGMQKLSPKMNRGEFLVIVSIEGRLFFHGFQIEFDAHVISNDFVGYQVLET